MFAKEHLIPPLTKAYLIIHSVAVLLRVFKKGNTRDGPLYSVYSYVRFSNGINRLSHSNLRESIYKDPILPFR